MNDYLIALADTALSVHWMVWLGLILGSVAAHYAQRSRDEETWEPTHVTVEVQP